MAPPFHIAATVGRPVVVTGMHRSGTSLVASMIDAAGTSMGDQQLEADAHNPRGYFEDLDFLTLQRQMLWAATPPDDGGHRDWGWTESERLAEPALAAFQRAARALVARRRGAMGPWGWKDPRTTLLLDFWQPLVPDAVYVLVYRHPWAVADSMQRLGAETFLRHPDYAYRIWAFYNQRLLRFRRAHRDRTLLVSADALARDPARLAPLLGSRWGAAGDGGRDAVAPGPDQRFAAELFHSLPADDPLVSLVAATHSPCVELLAALDDEAELSGRGTWRVRALAPRDSPRPRLSVVIPCYDQGELLIEAVASVERAVSDPYEVIVVNDGSRQPRTLEVLAVLRGGGYRIVDQDNRGLASARNRGIEEAQAPYVLPLDADNRLRAGFVAAAVGVLDARPEVGAVYGDPVEFGLRNERLRVPAFDLPTLLAGNFVDACALLRKEVWSANGGFDGAMPSPGWEDWDLWIGTAARGWALEHLPVAAFDYRVRPGSMVTTFEDPMLRRRALAYMLEKHRETYLANLEELLFFAQSSAREIHNLRLEVAAQSAASQELAERWADAQRDRLALREERANLYAELASWKERLHGMEKSRAWRARDRLLGILGAFGLGAARSARGNG